MEIWISLGIAVATIISNMVISAMANKKNVALLEYRLKQLEDKQNTHNKVIERMFKVEQEVVDLKEDVLECKRSLIG